MRKVLIVGLSILFLVGCNDKKEYPVNEVFIKDSAFGVSPNTTLEELKKSIELKEIRANIYHSNVAPKPYPYFNNYTYTFKDGKLCGVLAARKGGMKEKERFVDEYNKLRNLLNNVIYNANPSKFHSPVTRWIKENPLYLVRLGVYKKNNDVYFNFHVRYSHNCPI